MERLLNDSVDRVVFFVAVDATDLYTRETGLTSFTINYVLDNGSRGVMTSPTTAEIDGTNLPGLYSLAIDEAAMTNMDDANDMETLVLHITHTSIDPVTMKVLIYRTELTTISKLQRADKIIDTATTPWTLNYKQEGTETDLMSKTMKNTAGADITSKNNILGQLEQE